MNKRRGFKMTVQETSLRAYFDEVIDKIGHNQLIVVKVLHNHGDLTNMEISNILGWSINRVTPRTNELRKMNIIVLKDKRDCTVTGRKAMVWGVI